MPSIAYAARNQLDCTVAFAQSSAIESTDTNEFHSETGFRRQTSFHAFRRSGEKHVVPPFAEEGNQRPEERNLRRVRDVDPDAHDRTLASHG